jgi:spermidine/putrescine-binding protein
MKRVIALAGILVLLVSAVIFFRNQEDASKVLRVVTWSGYYPDSILAEFTKKTGIQVELSYISSNEELLAKIKAGARGFDIIQPSDYMIEQMTRLNMLRPLDKTLLTNLKHVEDYYFHLSYDPGLVFTVPFVRGTTGILVNTERVKLPQGELSWDLLFNSPDPRHTSLLDDMREVFSAVLYWQGKDPNCNDPKILEEVAKEIAKVKSQIALFSSEPQTLLMRGDVTIAHAFSTHGLQIALDYPHIKYFLPKGGNSVWTDNFAIPVGSRKALEAHQFINYFLEPDNALSLVQANHLATPNRSAKARLPSAMQNDILLYPTDKQLREMSFLHILDDEGLSAMIRLWTEVKS